jgi:hypothetical protein
VQAHLSLAVERRFNSARRDPAGFALNDEQRSAAGNPHDFEGQPGIQLPGRRRQDRGAGHPSKAAFLEGEHTDAGRPGRKRLVRRQKAIRAVRPDALRARLDGDGHSDRSNVRSILGQG